MIYIYDTVLKNTDKNSVFERYSVKYRLEAKHKMGSNVYYTFSAPGMEPLMVVPQFMEQYLELQKLIERFGQGKTYEKYVNRLRREVSVEEEDEYPSDTSDTKVMKVLSCSYKDIGVTFEYENSHIRLSKEFEIRQNNIFGNGLTISLLENNQDE